MNESRQERKLKYFNIQNRHAIIITTPIITIQSISNYKITTVYVYSTTILLQYIQNVYFHK